MSRRFRDTEKAHLHTRARAHVQMYRTHDLCYMHRYLISEHTPNFSLSAHPFLSYSLAANFYTPHFARATVTAQVDWVLVPFTVEGV